MIDEKTTQKLQAWFGRLRMMVFAQIKGDISKCEKPGRRANRVQLELNEVIEVAKGQLRTAMPCREHEF